MNYTVTAANSCGTNSATVSVTVSTISASFTASTTLGEAPLPVSFTNTSDPGAVSFFWNFDDGSTETTFSPVYLFSQAGQYNVQLTATNAAGCSDSYSLVITVTNLPSSLIIPNVFTPNGDHVNDEFIITSQNMESYQLQIMNRWGNVILTTSDPQKGWDGNIQGDQAAEGTYFYQVTATGTDQKNYNETGFFVLQR
ncbi:PKD domain protein [compost metagenome]